MSMSMSTSNQKYKLRAYVVKVCLMSVFLMTFPTTRMHRPRMHRPLTRPAVSSRGGTKTVLERAAEIEPTTSEVSVDDFI